MKRILKLFFVDFLWKSSYWGIPQEEVAAMGGPGYMKQFGVGPDLDKWDQKLFKTEPGEPNLLVVAVFVAIFTISVFLGKSL